MLAIACTAVKPPSAAAREAGLDRLGVLAAGLAQVRVQVDQARQRDEAGGVDLDVVAVDLRSRADRRDDAVAQHQVDRVARAEEPGAADEVDRVLLVHADSSVVAVAGWPSTGSWAPPSSR